MGYYQPMPAAGLPAFFTRLSVLCTNLGAHPVAMPVATQFSHFELSRLGQPVAAYVCPSCRAVHGMARHHLTGKPFRLFVRPA